MRQNIQDLYVKEEFFNQAQNFFNQEGFIQLQEFFKENEIISHIKNFTTDSEVQTLFQRHYSPLIENKHIFDISKTPSNVLEFVEFFKSKSFMDYVEQLVGFFLQYNSCEISKFTHKCFELIHDSKITTSMLIDVYFFITKDEFESQFGGDKVYTTYEEELFYITPQNNTLTCVFRDEGLRQYTKYINSLAKDKVYIQIKCEFEILGSLEEDLI